MYLGSSSSSIERSINIHIGKEWTVVNRFMYLGSTSSNESDINIRIDKQWSAIDRLTTVRKSDVFDKKKYGFSKL